MLRPAALFLVLSLPALAQDPSWPAGLNTVITETAAYCDGEFTLGDGAVTQADLNGDGTSDWVLDSGSFLCDGTSSLYCGVVGCGVDTFIGDVRGMLTLHSWDVLTEDGVTYLTAPNDKGETVRFLWSGTEWVLQ